MRFGEVGALLRRAEGWLLPGECLECHGPVGGADPLICPTCQLRWHRLPEPQCERCGQPAPSRAASCRVCAAWPDGLRQVRSAVWLDDTARRAVHALKYAGWWRVTDPMARLVARLAPLGAPGVLVPIPLAGRRARRRGYNQAERLARELSRRSTHPCRPELLRRARETPTQTALPPEARRANVAGAFAAGSIPEGLRIVLVDDVFTTGATLAEAAGCLLEAGAGSVDAVTFARARPPIF